VIPDRETGRTGPDRKGRYFYLSYAHSVPLSGNPHVPPDEWVAQLFYDLSGAVRERASPRFQLAPGFFDQEIPLDSNWKAVRSQALAAAEVFVPLYSPSYFARSLPGREWACFQQRLVHAEVADPLQRFVPVLWIPLPGNLDRRGMREALDLGAAEPAYAENGLRALLRLMPYRPAYRQVVSRLAARIVEIAESRPLGPSIVPDIDEAKSAFNPEAAASVFAVTVAAPVTRAALAGREPADYGANASDWRPFPGQALPLVEYAVRVAEELNFAALVTFMAVPGDPPHDRPGVFLIDPWIAADEKGLRSLISCIQGLPSWVLPLLILGSPVDAKTADYAERVRSVLASTGMVNSETSRLAMVGVGSLEHFVTLMPLLAAEAERQYLRHGPIRPTTARPGPRPRLVGSWYANPAPQPSREKPDD